MDLLSVRQGSSLGRRVSTLMDRHGDTEAIVKPLSDYLFGISMLVQRNLTRVSSPGARFQFHEGHRARDWQYSPSSKR